MGSGNGLLPDGTKQLSEPILMAKHCQDRYIKVEIQSDKYSHYLSTLIDHGRRLKKLQIH